MNSYCQTVIVRISGTKLKNAITHVNAIIHGIIFQKTGENPRVDGLQAGPSQSGECDRDSANGTGRRECRVAVIKPKKFPASMITIISMG